MYRAYWQFYKTIFPFIAAFSVACIAVGGLFWAFLLFVVIGPLIGILGFRFFYQDQFYFYYNLGITNSKLMSVSFLMNLLLGIPIFGIIILIIHFFLGNFTIT
ncbi:hypothetical protein AEQU2_02528 [Aequorivita lipolytica]|nr:hypothetical protein AEQU2_02528 [Aequorivita lipolytica]